MKLNNLKKYIIPALVSLVILLLPTVSVVAQGRDITGGGLRELKRASDQDAGGQGITDLGIRGTDRTAVVELIARIVNWILYLSGAIAVLLVIWGGFLYLTARGNDTQAGQGTKTIKNALLGLVIIILSYVIVNVVVDFITNA
jgi:hypothetical protein